MKECHKLILQRRTLELVKNLQPQPLLLYLYQKEIINQDDMDEVRSKKIRKDVNEDLIFMLMRRGPEAFSNLVEGLQRKQPFLTRSLLKEGKVNLQQTYNTKQVQIP